jgi:tetratricopeptide (TPR) repeat protein
MIIAGLLLIAGSIIDLFRYGYSMLDLAVFIIGFLITLAASKWNFFDEAKYRFLLMIPLVGIAYVGLMFSQNSFDKEFKKAETLLQKQDTEGAYTILKKLSDERPYDLSVSLELGKMFKLQGQYDRMEEYFANGLQLTPPDEDTALAQIAYLKEKGSVDEARLLLGELIVAYPTHVAVLENFGSLEEMSGTGGGYLQYYKEASDLPGVSKETLAKLASSDVKLPDLLSSFDMKPVEAQSIVP